jgi:hypothetical protein
MTFASTFLAITSAISGAQVTPSVVPNLRLLSGNWQPSVLRFLRLCVHRSTCESNSGLRLLPIANEVNVSLRLNDCREVRVSHAL